MKIIRLMGVILIGACSSHICLAQTKSSQFKVSANIVKGCAITNRDQTIDLGKHPVISQDLVKGAVLNSTQTWNIRCTENLPITLAIDGGQNYSNGTRRLKNENISDYINYQLHANSALSFEYAAGKIYSPQVTTQANPVLAFVVYSAADLNNNGQVRSAGVYKDTVAITITW